jgi:hypothetical protein
MDHQRQSDEAERSREEAIISCPREPSCWQYAAGLRAVAMEASYEIHGRFHVDFDDFFIEHTIGELIAMGDDRGESVRQGGVTTRRPDGESA